MIQASFKPLKEFPKALSFLEDGSNAGFFESECLTSDVDHVEDFLISKGYKLFGVDEKTNGHSVVTVFSKKVYECV